MAKIKLSQDKRNANRGTPRGQQMIQDSLRDYGAGRSILADKDGRVIAGNKTLEAATGLGIEVQEVHTTGDKLVVVVRDDLDLEQDAKARELAYADNRTGQVSLDFDPVQIQADLAAGFDLGKFWEPVELDKLLAGVRIPEFSPAGIQDIPEQWMIIINCVSEEQQTDLLQRFTDEGLKCKALLS